MSTDVAENLESYCRELAAAARAAGRALTTTNGSDRTAVLHRIAEELVRGAMRDSGGVKARAARQLGIPRSTLYHLLERYGIS